jgi:hypothetical protein
LPVTDVTQPLSEEELRLIHQKKRMAPPTNIGKVLLPPITEAAEWNRWVCENFGAGDYHFKLNDHHPSVKKTIAMCTTKGEGSLRNWDSFPPLLHHNEHDEIDEVVLTDPLNESYLRWARLQGIKFPGDPGTQSGPRDPEQIEEEDDMANTAALIDSTLKSNERLTDRVFEMAKEKRDAAPPQPDVNARAQLGAVETVTEGAKQMMGVMGQSMKQLMENQTKAADPETHLRQVIDLAKSLMPAPSSGNSELLAMMKMQMDAQQANFDRVLQMQQAAHDSTLKILTSRLESLEREKQNPAAAPSDEEKVLDRLMRIKNKLDDFAGESAAPAGPAWLAPTLDFAGNALDKITTGLGHLRALRENGTAQPAPAQQPTAQELPAAEKPPQEDPVLGMKRKYAELIHPHLITALRNGTPGHEFAGALIHETGGVASYDSIAGGGYNSVLDFLRSSPPLYQELLRPPIGGQMLEKFIAEFLQRDKALQCAALLKSASEPQQPQQPVNGPASQHRGPVVS